MMAPAILWQNPTSFCLMVASPQLLQWLVFYTWTAIPLFGSLSVTVLLLCAHTVYLSGSSWFPQHTLLHTRCKGSHTPLLSASLWEFLSSLSPSHVLEFSLAWGFTLSEAHIPSPSFRLDRWRRRCTVHSGSLPLFTHWGFRDRGGWAERVFLIKASGKPFAWNTWVRWSVSSFFLEGWQVLCAPFLMHLRTPVNVLE